MLPQVANAPTPGRVVDSAALESLIAATLDQAAGFLPDRVPEFAAFVAHLAPRGPDASPGGERPGARDVVDSAALECLVAAGRCATRRFPWRPGTRVCRSRCLRGATRSRCFPQVANAHYARGVVDSAALESLR